jgi:hypothetical protein
VDPVPDPLLFSGSAGNRTLASGSVAKNSWLLLYHRGGPRLATVATLMTVSRDSEVGTATAYELDYGRDGVRVSIGSRIFACPCRPDEHWGQPSILLKRAR